jgi:hypothetical protein
MQQTTCYQTIEANSLLRTLSSSQKQYLQTIFHKRSIKSGDVLWLSGEQVGAITLASVNDYLLFFPTINTSHLFIFFLPLFLPSFLHLTSAHTPCWLRTEPFVTTEPWA